MTIKEFLVESGVFPNLKGFNYLIKAVELVSKNPNMKTTKDLYPTIAKEYKDTATRVERAIRNIVSNKISMRQFNSVGINKRPNNSELIWFFATEGGKR